MRYFITLSIGLALVVPTFADVRKAATLAPSDLGAFKWIIGETAGEDEVVILRCVRSRTLGDKKMVEILDGVSYEPGKRYEGTFVAINPDHFNFEKKDEPNWYITTFTGTGWCLGSWTKSETTENSGSITFTNRKGEVTNYQFSSIILAYGEAAKLYKNLPAKPRSGTGWKWSGIPISVDSDQNGNAPAVPGSK